MKLNQINLNSLIHFYAIAKNRSLSSAARELNLSAPAITHSLNNLEESLKQKLCLRNRGGFQLTAAGVRLYESAQKIVNELDSFSLSQSNPTEFSGILSLGVLDHFDNKKVEKILYEVSQKFSKMKLSIQSYDSDTMNRLLLEKELDIGFGTFSNRSPRLKYIKIGAEVLRYYISKNHPLWKQKLISKEHLVGQKTTWLDNRNRTKSDLETNIFPENLKYKMKFFGFSNNLSAAVQILLSGHAVVPLPQSFGDSLSKTHPVRKIELETKAKVIDEVMAYNPNNIENPVAAQIIKQLNLDLS